MRIALYKGVYGTWHSITESVKMFDEVWLENVVYDDMMIIYEYDIGP